MTQCRNCNGVGLVSSAANPQDLSHGRKEVCKACGGKGQVDNSGDNSQGAGPSPSVPEESPKAKGTTREKAGGDVPGTQSYIEPKVGDRCRTENDRPGTLQLGPDGWVCVAD